MDPAGARLGFPLRHAAEARLGVLRVAHPEDESGRDTRRDEFWREDERRVRGLRS